MNVNTHTARRRQGPQRQAALDAAEKDTFRAELYGNRPDMEQRPARPRAPTPSLPTPARATPALAESRARKQAQRALEHSPQRCDLRLAPDPNPPPTPHPCEREARIATDPAARLATIDECISDTDPLPRNVSAALLKHPVGPPATRRSSRLAPTISGSRSASSH